MPTARGLANRHSPRVYWQVDRPSIHAQFRDPCMSTTTFPFESIQVSPSFLTLPSLAVYNKIYMCPTTSPQQYARKNRNSPLVSAMPVACPRLSRGTRCWSAPRVHHIPHPALPLPIHVSKCRQSAIFLVVRQDEQSISQ